MRLASLLAVLVLSVAAAQPQVAAAQPAVPLAIDYAVEGTASYDPAVPTPGEVLGFTIGERHTRPEEVVRYVEAVAAASPRVEVGFHGETYEGRRLVHAVVSSPANLARIGEIQAQNVRLSEAPGSVSDAELARMPAVVYQGYSVHGDEATGTEAALVYLYHLAAGQGGVAELLDDAVVLIDPMLNPDGRDRFVDWANGNRGGVVVADDQDREHNQPWPRGRTNHYLFDLNRDWLPTELAESRGRMAWWHTWRPQVSTDHHEMGGEATFFFQPGIPSRNNPNTPQTTLDLTADIADYHAAELDRIGSLYYSRESFDDFYYGKGSTYPDVNGAVGILFEQASSRALEVETEQNGLLTYAFGVRNQLATSVSTLRAAVALRERLLRNARDFYRDGLDDGAYVIALDRRRTRAQALAQALQRSRVRVYRSAREVEVAGRRVPAGEALVVPLDQPQGRLVRAAMERTLEYGDSLFYDVSTWTFPLAYGADVAEVDRAGGLAGEPVEVAFDGGRLVGGAARTAYLVRWDRYFAPRTLRRLQDAGVRVRLATSPFSAAAGGVARDFEAGTLVVPVQNAGAPADSVHAIVRRAVAEDHVEAFALASGYTPTGNDLGSREWPVLRPARVALLAGPGASPYGAGEAWHLLSERFGQRVSLLEPEDVGRADLDRYTVLVMADGSYAPIDSAATARVEAWVRDGGTLVATEGGARWAARAGLLGAEPRPAPPDSTDYLYADRDAARGAQAVGGSIFDVALDPTHPLAYGYGDRVAVFKGDAALFEPGEGGAGVDVGVFTDEPVLSGYISGRNLERLPGAAALKARRVGRGGVALLDFDPAFRAFWRGTDGLLLNAVYLGGAF
ncbi:M14 family metallopeptidase [Rubrivirga litoralis]|uniref:M14 family metallopeptidase n=1 Tax=Rubrivirga litoralis TaxID=3075598 RepID=A0ABU3BS64_9BACT|nr:M14 family metallopeptidase [Rubrivirga sp. F394]MDT0632131.1 M14 family metallopeptidase [Rubrivirga sp. F394]